MNSGFCTLINCCSAALFLLQEVWMLALCATSTEMGECARAQPHRLHYVERVTLI